jgi:Extensin-like protein C-terminus
MPATGKHDPQGRSALSRRNLFRASAIGGLGLAGAGVVGGVTAANADSEPTGSTMRYIPQRINRADQRAPNEKAFSDVDGVPTYYIRGGSHDPATFYCTFGFFDSLVAWMQRFKQFSAEAGYAEVAILTSAGAYVDKPGAHGEGVAIDVDRIDWADGTISSMIDQDWASGDRQLHKRYYGVDASLRIFFRWGLDRTYNAAHHDHFHMDFYGLPVQLSTGSSSDVGWVQAACNEFMDAGLVEDQVWGPLTQAAFDESKSRLGITGDPQSDPAAYVAWLEAVTVRGLTNQPF